MKNLILAFICLLLAVPCGARTITVDDDGPADFSNIQAAINDANDGDTIIVASGTYTGPGNRDIDFLGKAITVRSIDPCDPDLVTATIIDCDGTEAEPHRGFYFHNGEDANSVLSGFVITNGYGPDEETYYNQMCSAGGAIFCDSSSPTISHCNITSNIAYCGGGVYCDNANPKISQCNITGNSSDNQNGGEGGGILCQYGSSPRISHCIISGNSVGGVGHGGGINCGAGSPKIYNCFISDNSTGHLGYGGAIDSTGSYMQIRHCTITHNSAGYRGGGIYKMFGNLTISNSIAWGNTCKYGNDISGGALVSYSDIKGGYPGEGNIDADPVFVNPSAGDYHLSTASPCMNTGDPNYEGGTLETDNDGDLRVINTRTDMGADEVDYEGPLIEILSTEFEFHAIKDGHNPDTQILKIRNNGSGTLSWEVTENCSWLEAEPSNGESTGETDQVLLAVNISGLSVGSYNFELEVAADGIINSPQKISVNLIIHAPVIELSSLAFEFLGIEGGLNPEDQTLTVRNSDLGTLNWVISSDCSWLQVTPTSGDSMGEFDQVTLSVDISGLTAGLYNCELVITAEGAVNSPQTIVVVLSVGIELGVPSEYETIQAAIDHANDGDVIVVQPGTYTGDGNRDIDFKGKTITVKSEILPEDCIIDCNGAEGNPHRGFYFHNGEDARSVVEGFAIINGYAELGGAICCESSSPTIKNCILRDNTGLKIEIWEIEPGVEIVEYYGKGGAIYCNSGSSPAVINCDIKNNSTYFGGGGINCDNSNPTIENCRITNNGDCYRGGAINCWRSNPIIKNCLITGNSSIEYGGAIACKSDYCNVEIINCTISDNASGRSGALDLITATASITNSILWGNSPKEIYKTSGDKAVIMYSNIRAGYPGQGNINADPCFVQPGYWDANGTPADANDDFWVEGDYHLLQDSPCINTGDPNYIPEPNETDLDGNPRIIGGRIDMGAYEFNHRPIAVAGPNQVVYAWIDGFANVNLDGSGSCDDDNDVLDYYWSWTIDGNDYESNGVSPTIQLPVGEHIIELIVNDGIDDSEPDRVTITVIEPMESRLWIFPQIINRYSRQRRIMAWLRLPEGITKDQIDKDVPLILYPGGIEATRQYIFNIRSHRRSTQHAIVFAYFDRAELLDAVPDNGQLEMQVVGQLKSGQYFYGSDTIRIIAPRPPHRPHYRRR